MTRFNWSAVNPYSPIIKRIRSLRIFRHVGSSQRIHDDVSELLFTEFDGKSIQEVSAMLANVNIEQFISTLTAVEPADLNDIDLFEQELILNTSHTPVLNK